MGNARVLAWVGTLGREFVLRGMREEARRLRLFYLAVRHSLIDPARESEILWTEEHVVEWMKRLRIAPYQAAYPRRERSSRCSRCTGFHGSIVTEAIFPGGAKMVCRACKAAWLEEDVPS